MGDIIKTHGNGANLPAERPEKELAILGALVTFNQLRAFKLDGAEAEAWMRTIMRTHPDLDIQRLRIAIDAMITGDIPYDDRLGIRNIVNALRRVIWDDGKWKILKPIY